MNLYYKNKILFLIIFTLILLDTIYFFNSHKILQYLTNNYVTIKKNILNANKSKKNIHLEKCYLLSDDTNIKIVHIIITRFIIDFWTYDDFPKKIYKKDYIINGIRVMKKYLLPSLENQSCRKFIWILMLGNKANISFVKSFFNFEISFDYKIIYQKNIKNYIRNISSGSDVLITTSIDYDDRIYFDAVNDVRKAININKPVFLYGYNRGVHYYESDDKYYEFNITYKNEGVASIFFSLIIVLNKVNDTYIVYDLGTHITIRKTLLQKYKSFGINDLNYEPSLFDSGDIKFVWVRQNFSGRYKFSKNIKRTLKAYNFNLSKFYGK